MDMAIEQGLITKDYWKDFTLGRKTEPIPPFVPNSREWVERAYREFYFRPRKIYEQVMNIRSFNDLKKNISGFIGLLLFKMSDDDILEVVSTGVDSHGNVTEKALHLSKGLDGAAPVARWIEKNKTYGQDIFQPNWASEEHDHNHDSAGAIPEKESVPVLAGTSHGS